MSHKPYIDNGPRPTLKTGRNRKTIINTDSHQDASAKLSPGRRATYSQPEAVQKTAPTSPQQDNMKKLMEAQATPAFKPADFSAGKAAQDNTANMAMGLMSMAAMAKAAKKGGGSTPFSNSGALYGVGPQANMPQGGNPRQNIRLGRAMAAEAGWKGAEWRALKALWMRESGWRTHAANPDSTARGIPQAMASVHFGDDWQGSAAFRKFWSNPKRQIAWGIQYIQDRYGSAREALQHSNREGWY